MGFGEIAKDLMNKDNNNKALITALKEIESLTRNPREYEPSYYTINHIARTALNMA
jgi:ribosomal protein S9